MKKRDWIMIVIVISTFMLFAITVVCIIHANCMTGNIATMVSGVISAAATVILGAIAIWQNKRYKKLSDDNAQKIEKLTLTPECYLAEIETRKPPVIPCKTMIPDGIAGKYYYLIFSSLNQPMLNVSISNISFYDQQRNPLSKYPNEKASFLTNMRILTVFENYTRFAFEILIPEEYTSQDIYCEVFLEYNNIYGMSICKRISFDKCKDTASIKNIVSEQAKILKQ